MEYNETGDWENTCNRVDALANSMVLKLSQPQRLR